MSLFGGSRKDDGLEQEAAEPRSIEGVLGGHGRERGRGVSTLDRLRTDGMTVGGGVMANIGKSISIRGDLNGNEDLVIEGKVEGKIELPSNQLTVGADGHVSAEVNAKSVVVVGRLTGNIHATERVEIQAAGSVDGDVHTPRLVVEEGAVLNGTVETAQKQAVPTSLPRPAAASAEKSAVSGS